MCGFAGFFVPAGLDNRADDALKAMSGAIEHRGPDAEGYWSDPEAGIALAHRRLAIIDVSAAGSQPMHSADGRYAISYNGEIYNFRELRRELEADDRAPAWRGHSDTEVLLAAIDAWGLKQALQRARGMFALALWDRRDRTLALARDRMGEKPLYYGWQGEGRSRTFLFGSDLAALRTHRSFNGQLDTAAIESLLRLLYIPDPQSVYRGISKLMPGTVLTLDAAGGSATVETYWDTLEIAATARAKPFGGTAEEAVDALAGVLGRAVESQMVSDVPLGAFLSGGIDSSVIVALMQQASTRPVKTFTIGFAESEFDEAVHARALAAHLGTDHHEMLVSPRDALDVIPQLPGMYSEPFADSSQIPTFLVSRLARAQVTVSLSGDAGDELFGGYNRHLYAHRRWPTIARLPRTLRAIAGRLIASVPPAAWDRSAGTFMRTRTRFVGDKLHKAADAMASATPEELYSHLVTVNRDANDLMIGNKNPPPADAGNAAMDGWTAVEKIMVLDAVHYLPGDILVKVDRASMAVSLESRVPFLDPEVIGFAWSLPVDYKIRNGVSKWPVRQLLHRHVPRALVERPKMGFTMPIGDWLRGPLRDWAEALLDDKAIREGGLFRPAAVQSLWSQHLRGARNNEHRLWPLLMTQAWLQSERHASGAPVTDLRMAAAN